MSLSDHFSPKKTTCLFGLKDQFKFLNELIINNKFPNVLLLSGDKGVGKSTLINHLLYSYFDKENYDLENCTLLKNSNFFSQYQDNLNPNVIYLNTFFSKSTKIEDIRVLKDHLLKKSITSNKRFIIFDDIEILNINSLNALLKIIEEPPKNNYFVLVNNKSKPLLETLKSRCIEIKIILKEYERKDIILKLMNFFQQKTNLDHHLIRTSPGQFLKFNKIFNESNINFNENFLDGFNILLNLYKKDKDIFYKDILLFFTDYYMKFSKRLSKDDKKIIENRTFIVKSINDFFLYNLSQNTLLNSIENKLSNE